MSAFGRLMTTSERDKVQQMADSVDEVVNDELEKTIASTQQEAKKHFDVTKSPADIDFSAYKLADDAYKSFKLKVKEKYNEDSPDYELAVAIANGLSWRFYGPRSIQKQLRLIMTDSDN